MSFFRRRFARHERTRSQQEPEAYTDDDEAHPESKKKSKASPSLAARPNLSAWGASRHSISAGKSSQSVSSLDPGLERRGNPTHQGETSRQKQPGSLRTSAAKRLEPGYYHGTPTKTVRQTYMVSRMFKWEIPHIFAACSDQGVPDLGQILVLTDRGGDRFDLITVESFMDDLFLMMRQRVGWHRHEYFSWLNNLCHSVMDLKNSEGEVAFENQFSKGVLAVKGIASSAWLQIDVISPYKAYCPWFLGIMSLTISILTGAEKDSLSYLHVGDMLNEFSGILSELYEEEQWDDEDVHTRFSLEEGPAPIVMEPLEGGSYFEHFNTADPKSNYRGFSKSGKSYCWKGLFRSANIIPQIDGLGYLGEDDDEDLWPPGLRMPYTSLLHLSGVQHEVKYDGGIILLGFDTALIPIADEWISSSDGGMMRWHFVRTPGKQVCCDVADSFEGKRAMLQDLSEVPAIAVVGWSADARIFLGSEENKANFNEVGYTILDPAGYRTKTIEWRGSLGMHTTFGVGGLLTQGSNITATSRCLPIVAAIDPGRNHSDILNQAGTSYFIIYDASTMQSWLMPGTNVLLGCLQNYLHVNNYIGYPSFLVDLADVTSFEEKGPPSYTADRTESRSGGSAEAVLAKNDIYTKVEQMLPIESSYLVSRFWWRISEADRLSRNPTTHLLMNSISGLKGVELCDIAGNKALQLKQLPVYDAMKAWAKLAIGVPVIFCSNAGDLIRPATRGERNICSASDGVRHPVGALTCLTADLRKAIGMVAAQTSCGYCWRATGGLEWRVQQTRGLFKTCTHQSYDLGGQKNGPQTCWSKDLLQKTSNFNENMYNVRGRKKHWSLYHAWKVYNGHTAVQVVAVVDVPESAAVRFG